jgi:hypothetical protein
VNLDPLRYCAVRIIVSTTANAQGCLMSEVTDRIFKSRGYGRGRRVSIARDGDDFTVAFQPENHVIFRHRSVVPLRNIFRKLQWKIVEDKSIPDNFEDMRDYLSGLGLE